jgi:hypothetical protein
VPLRGYLDRNLILLAFGVRVMFAARDQMDADFVRDGKCRDEEITTCARKYWVSDLGALSPALLAELKRHRWDRRPAPGPINY